MNNNRREKKIIFLKRKMLSFHHENWSVLLIQLSFIILPGNYLKYASSYNVCQLNQLL